MTIHLELIALQQVAENRLLCLVNGLVLVTLATLPAASIMLLDCLASRWGVWIVISVTISNPDYFHYLLTRSSSATRP